MEIEPKILGAAMQIGQYHESQFSPGLAPNQRIYELVSRIDQVLDKHGATIALINGAPEVVQSADPSLFVMLNGSPLSLRQVADEAMGTSEAPATQASNEPNSAFHRQLSQSMANQGLQALPNSTMPPDKVNRYLEPFRRQLSQSIADQQKNYKA